MKIDLLHVLIVLAVIALLLFIFRGAGRWRSR
jgi:hypothetical protein